MYKAIPYISAVIVFIAVIALAEYFIIDEKNRYEEELRLELSHQLEVLKDELKDEINSRFHLTESLSAFVLTNPEFTEKEFQRFAESLLIDRREVKSLQLAPDGIVTYITNPEKNRSIIGYDIFTSKFKRNMLPELGKSKNLYIEGPINLIQGGIGIIARRPIYLQTNENENQFWGFATVLIDPVELFIRAVAKGPQIYRSVALAKVDTDSQEIQWIHGPETIRGSIDTTLDIGLIGADWVLAADFNSVINQRLDDIGIFRIESVLAIIGALVAAYFLFYITRIPQLLKREVNVATSKLKESNEKLEDFVKTSTDWIWETDKDLKIRMLVINDLKYGEVDTGKLFGTSMLDYIDPETTPENELNEFKLRQSQHLPYKNIRCYFSRLPKHTSGWLVLNGTPFYDTNNEFMGYRGTARNISSEVEAESVLEQARDSAEQMSIDLEQQVCLRTKELALERDFAENLLESTEALILHLDRQGRVWRLNTCVTNITGYPAAKLIDADWAENFAPQLSRDEQKRLIHSVLHDLRPPETITNVRTADGRELYLQWRFRPLHDTEGKPNGVIATGNDITDLRERDAVVAHTQKMAAVGQLSGGIAHDFNNILGIIIGNCDLLQSDVANHKGATKRIDNILRSAERGSKLVKQMLSFSGYEHKDPKPVSLNSVLDDMDELIQRSITSRVEVHRDFAPDLWETVVDIGDLQDAIINMVINASHAMVDGGHLTLKTDNVDIDEDKSTRDIRLQKGSFVRITIADTGCGIPDKVIERIYEPFFSTKGPGKGTGLGLSMVFSFIERSKGFITVDSQKDLGTSFEIYLPKSKHHTLHHVA